MKKMILLSMVLLISVLCPLSSESANLPIVKTWDINNGSRKPWELQLFQANGVDLTLSAQDGYGQPFTLLTNDTVVWEITGWNDYTNTYAATTCTVVSATGGVVTATFDPAELNLPVDGLYSTYRGYIKAYTTDGTNFTTRAVLAYQKIRLDYSSASIDYDIVDPLPVQYYTKAEVDDLIASATDTNLAAIVTQATNDLAGLTTEVTEAQSSVTNHESRITNIESQTNLIQSAVQPTDATYTQTVALASGAVQTTVYTEFTAASSNRFQALEGQTNLIQSAVQPTDVTYTQTVALAASAQPVATAATDAELSAGLALKVNADGSNISTNYTLPDTITVSGWSDSEFNTNYVYVAEYDDWEYDGTVWAGVYWYGDHWEFWVDDAAVDTNTTTDATVLPKTGWSVITVDYSGSQGLWVEEIGGAAKTEVSALSDSVATLQQTAITNSYTNGTVGIIVGGLVSSGRMSVSGTSALIYAGSSIGGSSAQASIESGLGVVSISATDEINGPGAIGLNGNVTASDDLASDTLTLDSTISQWSDIAPVQGVPLNAPITITNDSSWTGWTTTGSLSGTNIVLAAGQYLLSPVQTNGIADWTITQTPVGQYTWSSYLVTNGVALADVVWYVDNAQLMITNAGAMPAPTAPAAFTISSIQIVGFEDPAEATTAKYVSSLCSIEQETRDCQLTRKVYVDAGDAASVASASASLAAYAADADKTVVCARLRIGEDYELVGDCGADGTIWAVNGCQITGGGELVATEYGLGITRNGRQLLSFRDYASGVYITNFNATTWTVDVATNGVTSTPFLEWSPSLTVQDWQTLPDTPTLTNAVYRFTVADPPTNSTVFVRAMQPEGTSAVVIDAQVLTLKDSAGDSWSITISTNGVLETTKE